LGTRKATAVLSKWNLSSKLERHMIMSRTLMAVAATAAIAAGSIAIPSNADARTHARHYYGRALGGSYARATRVYAADHYYRRPYQQSFNPDFQLGGNRSW
jgi:hypothetical protein